MGYLYLFSASSAESGWRRMIVLSVVHRINEVTVRRTRLVLGWVTVLGGYTISLFNLLLSQLSAASLRGR